MFPWVFYHVVIIMLFNYMLIYVNEKLEGSRVVLCV